MFLSVANVFDRKKKILLKTCLIGTLQLTLIVSGMFGDRFIAIVCNPPLHYYLHLMSRSPFSKLKKNSSLLFTRDRSHEMYLAHEIQQPIENLMGKTNIPTPPIIFYDAKICTLCLILLRSFAFL